MVSSTTLTSTMVSSTTVPSTMVVNLGSCSVIFTQWPVRDSDQGTLVLIYPRSCASSKLSLFCFGTFVLGFYHQPRPRLFLFSAKRQKFSLTIHFHKYHISLLLRAKFPATRGGIFSWWVLGGHLRTGHSRRHPTPGLVGSRPSLARGSQEETEIWEIRSCMQTMVVGKR